MQDLEDAKARNARVTRGAQIRPGAQVTLVVAPYYDHVAAMLVAGASRALENAQVAWRIVEVPGAFEIPPAIAILADRPEPAHGFVALGCVIRGETSHYDYVCGQSARALMELGLNHKIAIGYGILTCERIDQAIKRADPDQGDKGGEAANACLALMALKVWAAP